MSLERSLELLRFSWMGKKFRFSSPRFRMESHRFLWGKGGNADETGQGFYRSPQCWLSLFLILGRVSFSWDRFPVASEGYSSLERLWHYAVFLLSWMSDFILSETQYEGSLDFQAVFLLQPVGFIIGWQIVSLRRNSLEFQVYGGSRNFILISSPSEGWPQCTVK